MLERIAGAALRAGRDPRDVTLVAVSKAVPPARLRAALAAGIDTFGENRVQEAESKAADVPGARWQMVGHLQGNKAPRAVALFEVIQSVDSVVLAERLARAVAAAGTHLPLPIYLQVNVDRDPRKQGFEPAGLWPALERIVDLSELDVRGLMTVGRAVRQPEQARPTFRALRMLRDEAVARLGSLGRGLSMGMSDDFEVAVEEGATIVRIGRALFGDRPSA